MSTYEISQSSLLSLKAEILRKQQELTKTKAENDIKIKIIKKNTPLEIKNKGVELRNKQDVEVNPDLLKQSQSSLELKAALYDRLSEGKLSEEEKILNRRFLVRFDKKNRSVNNLPPEDWNDEPDKYSEDEEDRYKSDEDNYKDPSEKWVDYVDCLGRTRKCLQKDLKYFQSKDEELKETVESRKERNNSEKNVKQSPTRDVIEKPEVDTPDNQELLSSDMQRELLRQQWEKEEEELRNKANIHYQDILFGEARTHGVGYYGFSKDEEERRKQLDALKKLRQETEDKQKKAQELKAVREKQLAARIKAAKDRKRARLGLPPEEVEQPDPAPVAPNLEEKQKQEEDKKKEELEKYLEKIRKRHIRPWDIGKEGVSKEHYEMTQEEWVDKKRSERPKEFAPPNKFDEDKRDNPLKFTTKKESKQSNHNRKRTHDEVHEKSQSSNFQPVLIQDLNTSDDEDRLILDYNALKDEKISKNKNRKKGAEIAPPPTYDYYGPSGSKTRKSQSVNNNIQESIEAGLKFLKNQIENKQKKSRRSEDIF